MEYFSFDGELSSTWTGLPYARGQEGPGPGAWVKENKSGSIRGCDGR